MCQACLWMALFCGQVDAGGHEHRLISTAENLNRSNWKIAGDRESSGPAWSVELKTLHGGKQEGVQLLLLNNGTLTITLVPTRGLGILEVRRGDFRLGWNSPVKEVVHPAFIQPQARGGLGWLEGFNEWMCRCGLESNGHPGTDRFINNVGQEAEMELTLHGKIANIPASEVRVRVDRQPTPTLTVLGTVQERMFYGPKLRLLTGLRTTVGSDAFEIFDEVTNEGADDQEFELLYHTNFGEPLLEQGAKFRAAVESIFPFNEHAAKGLTGYDEYPSPTRGFVEQVYCLRLQGDEQGWTTVMLQNKGGTRAASMQFSVREFPYFTLWKNPTAREEGYVTGLEPGTNYPYNRRIERQFGRVPKLKPGETRRFTLRFGVHDNAAEIRRIADAIQTLQGSIHPKVKLSPPRIEAAAPPRGTNQ